MHFLWEILIGFLVGLVAKFLMPGKDPGGFFVTVLIGIAGSIVATFLGQRLSLYEAGAGAGFLMSVIGAMLLLWVYRLISAKR